jgi:signal transduction histidine kinase
VSVSVLGIVSLAGWILDFHPEPGFLGLVAMKANTAVCFTLAGLSLTLQSSPSVIPSKHAYLARGLAAVVVTVALVTAAEYMFNLDLEIDQLLFEDTPPETGPSFPGRMAPASASNFVLLGLALLLLDTPVGPNRRWPAQYLTFGSLVITLLAFIAYFYRVEVPVKTAPYVTIALHTLIGFAILSLGILIARPDRGVLAALTGNSPGSVVARRLLPAAILFPLLVGWLSNLAERAGLLGFGFGTAIFAISLILAFTGLVLWAAHGLNRTDAERKGIQRELLVSRERLRGLASRLQAAREQERASLAREIHDTMAQELTRLKLDIAWLNRRMSRPVKEADQNLVREKLAAMREVTDLSISTVQRLATELRPVVLDTLGLYAAIEWQVRDFEARTGVHCEIFLPEGTPKLDQERSTAIFRILQESLTNIARHARATKVEVCLHVTPMNVSLSVRDNGSGIAEGKLGDPHSLGLIGMRERAALLNGECRVSGLPTGGTSVDISLPFEVGIGVETNPI